MNVQLLDESPGCAHSNPARIQDVVERSGVASIYSGEQKLNPPESAIRLRFVRVCSFTGKIRIAFSSFAALGRYSSAAKPFFRLAFASRDRHVLRGLEFRATTRDPGLR